MRPSSSAPTACPAATSPTLATHTRFALLGRPHSFAGAKLLPVAPAVLRLAFSAPAARRRLPAQGVRGLSLVLLSPTSIIRRRKSSSA